MTDRTKRIIFLLAFLLSTAVIAFALYIVFFRSSPPPAIDTPPQTSQGTLPTIGEGTPVIPDLGQGGALPTPNTGTTTPTSLTESAVQYPTLMGGQVGYYDATDGRFYHVDAAGTITALSEAKFPNVTSTAWNTNGTKAVLEFPDGSNIVYDFTTNEQVTLPSHWEDFSFSPTGDEIAAKSLGLDAKSRYLVISSADGSHVQAVQPLGTNESLVQISWSPNNQIIAFANTATNGTGLDGKTLIPIGKNQENFKGISVEGRGFMPKWSPDGRTLLYSSHGDYSSERPLLWLADGSAGTVGEGRRDLGLYTWADKCTFANTTTLYCAVPQGIPANAALIRERWRTAPDTLYRIDVASGRSEVAMTFSESTSMEDLLIDTTGGILFFRNVQTGALDKVTL